MLIWKPQSSLSRALNLILSHNHYTQKFVGGYLKGAQIREEYYTQLLDENLSPAEKAQIATMTAAMILSAVSGAMETAASIGYAVPQQGSPFAMTYGGEQLGASLTKAAASLKMAAEFFNFGSSLSSLLGGFHRRSQDWELQKKLATVDIAQIGKQIAAAEVRVKISQKDIEITKQSIKHNESIETFMKGKFTNQQLYQWMSNKLSGIYFQTYNMAIDLAQAAQKAF